jgi:hypothetical protein
MKLFYENQTLNFNGNTFCLQVKHFSKYGLVDDSDDEDMPEQDKKRLRLAQEQQIAVQVSYYIRTK